MNCEKLFVSKNIVLEDSIYSGGILVNESGRITSILLPCDCLPRENLEILDVGDLFLMPGVIDTHVHINEPGRTDWEGYVTATKAGAAGGITTMVDMPLNSIPATTSLKNFNIKIEAAQEKAHVDLAFWGGVIPGNEGELLKMIDAGVVGFKCFMCPSGVDEFPYVEYDDIVKAMRVLENSNSVLAFHAELKGESPPRNGDTRSYETFLETEPPKTEIDAISQIIELLRTYKTRCHIVHLSTSEAIPLIKRAKEDGANLTVETCHHYLTFSSEMVPYKATQYKCLPPIRDAANREKLWEGLDCGVIEMVVSDHSPCTPDLKLLSDNYNNQENAGDFIKAWGGISSVQFGLSLFWTAAKRRNYNLMDIGKFLTRTPAKLVGLHTYKGQIKPGFDADFVIWDPNEIFEVTEEIIQHKNKITPYLGMNLHGKVYKTIVRGQVVYELGKPIEPPKGKLLINM